MDLVPRARMVEIDGGNFSVIKRESDRKDRKCLNHAHAQSFDRVEGQRSRFLVLTKRSAACGDQNGLKTERQPVSRQSCAVDFLAFP